MNIIAILPFAMLGALMGLDVVSFPQAMISRPLVSATLGGALAGRPLAGLLAGATLELFAIETLPFGASRYPEWGSASVVAGALIAIPTAVTAGSLTLAVMSGLATAGIGGASMVALRKLNAQWARRRRDALEAGSRETVVGLQLAGMTADLVRGGLITAAALFALQPIVRAAIAIWSIDARISRAIVVGVASAVAGGAMWKLFRATENARWYLIAGFVVGLLIIWRLQ